MELSNRKKQILKIIISDYIRTADPVGSKAIASRPELNFSSATIRNEMSELEEMGYLEKPHTSAGRVPSPLGYRLYVDELMGLPDLPSAEAKRIDKAMELKIKELDKLISEAGKLISNLTQYTSLALTPAINTPTLRRFEIIRIAPQDFVIVIVTTSGEVKNKLVRTACDVSAEEAELLTYVLNQTLTGIPLEQITAERIDVVRRAAGLTALLAPVAEYIAELIEEAGEQKVFLEGESKLLAFPEYRDAHKAQQLLDYISDDVNMNALKSVTREIDGVRITIGPENGAGPLADTSMIYASYNIGRIGRGVIGIVGPTRMDYGKVSARLTHFAKKLNELIAETLIDDIEK